MHCGICRVLWSDLKEKLDKDTINLEHLGTLSPVSRSEIFSVTASLSVLNDSLSMENEDMEHYRLDFKLRFEKIRSQRTFVLRQTSELFTYCRIVRQLSASEHAKGRPLWEPLPDGT
jgi:hypothetical protein